MVNIYTIGYATKPVELFIAQLKRYHINVVADIRSVPYSKVFTEYHKENIILTLKNNGIKYVYLGDELGPRSKDDNHYDETGQVQFERLMTSSLFKTGIERLNNGVNKGFNIALMCAEKDPATCHRSTLVGYYLFRHGLGEADMDETCIGEPPPDTSLVLQHIDHHGELESQKELEDRISAMHDTSEDLFRSKEECDYTAYKIQLQKTSYRKPE